MWLCPRLPNHPGFEDAIRRRYHRPFSRPDPTASYGSWRKRKPIDHTDNYRILRPTPQPTCSYETDRCPSLTARVGSRSFPMSENAFGDRTEESGREKTPRSVFGLGWEFSHRPGLLWMKRPGWSFCTADSEHGLRFDPKSQQWPYVDNVPALPFIEKLSIFHNCERVKRPPSLAGLHRHLGAVRPAQKLNFTLSTCVDPLALLCRFGGAPPRPQLRQITNTGESFCSPSRRVFVDAELLHDPTAWSDYRAKLLPSTFVRGNHRVTTATDLRRSIREKFYCASSNILPVSAFCRL